MSAPRHLRCYQYVNRPFLPVRALLRERGRQVFQRAIGSASARADTLLSTLRVSVAGFELGVDVVLRVTSMRDEEGIAGMSPVTRVALQWEAARAAALFPAMNAVLSMWPISADETQLEIAGEYNPPLGPLGQAADAAALHRIADAAVHRFLEDVVEQIKREIAPKGAAREERPA